MWKRLILVPGLGTPSCQHPASPYLQHLSSLSPRGPGASASPLPPWEVSPGSGLSLLVPRDTACPCGLEGDLWPPPLQALPTSPMTHPHCRERLMLAAALAPSRKRQCPWPRPNLEHCPALFSQLFEAKATPDPRQGPGARSSEACWVGTFQDWLSRGLTTAVELVRAGVSSMEPEDTTQCWGWGPELSHWAARGSPTRGHCVPHTPCIHVLGRGNASVPSWGGRGYMDGQILGQHQPLMEEEEVGRARAAPSPRPAFPEMGSHELRLASFCDWPLTALVRPELLASAGFFHTGQQGKVRCFFCNGGLQSWERGDDPWTQHAMWFPRCEFLLQTKGRDFVCSVQESCCHLLSSWDPWEEPEDTAPSTPSAPVHPGPELPMTRRETRSEGGREPGVRNTEEQLQRLREERTCKVCLDRTVCIVFVPCGHLVCAECAPHLQQCPICRAPVHSCVRTFLS